MILGMLWGCVPTISKYVTQQGVSPLSYSFWVLAIAAFILLVIGLIGNRLPPRQHIAFYFICGLTGTSIPTTVMYFALAKIPASLMVILLTVSPVFTFLFSSIFKLEKYHLLKIVGLLSAFGGLMMILMPNSISEMNAPLWAILLGVCTPMFYAINIVYTVKYRPEFLKNTDISTGMLLTAALFMLAVVSLFDSIYPLWDAEPNVTALIITHGIITAVGFYLFYILLKLAGPLFTSQVTFTVTLFGIAIGSYVFNETLPLLVWLAAALMLLGIGLVYRARRLTGEA